MAENANSTRARNAKEAAQDARQLRDALSKISKFELSGWLPLLYIHSHQQDRPCLPAAANLLNILKESIERSERDGGLADSIIASALEGILILMTLEMIGAETEQAGDQ